MDQMLLTPVYKKVFERLNFFERTIVDRIRTNFTKVTVYNSCGIVHVDYIKK